MYDYMAAMRQDIKEYIKENKEALQGLTREEAEEKLYDDMWTADSVTGNASGSYTFSRARAKEYVLGNTDLLKEAYGEFGSKSQFAEHFFDDNWEVMDVTIRCWLLGQVLSDVLDGMQLPF